MAITSAISGSKAEIQQRWFILGVRCIDCDGISEFPEIWVKLSLLPPGTLESMSMVGRFFMRTANVFLWLLGRNKTAEILIDWPDTCALKTYLRAAKTEDMAGGNFVIHHLARNPLQALELFCAEHGKPKE